MKKSFLIILATLFIGVLSAKAQNDNPAKAANCVCRVDFGSPGSGIDLKTYDAIKKIIDNNKLKYTEVPNGREGEVYLCLQMTEVSKKKKKQIIKELKSTAKNGQFTSVSTS